MGLTAPESDDVVKLTRRPDRSDGGVKAVGVRLNLGGAIAEMCCFRPFFK